jgi:hypothetical protein
LLCSFSNSGAREFSDFPTFFSFPMYHRGAEEIVFQKNIILRKCKPALL